MKGGLRHRTVRGLAVMEAAVWSVALLPVGLLAVAMSALAHDQNMVQTIPEALLREVSGRSMRWEANGDEGEFVVDISNARRTIRVLADRGVEEARVGTFKLQSPSARACFWVFSVHSIGGSVGALEASECEDRGDLGASISFESARAERLASGVSLPLHEGGGFVDRVVLFGVAVAGLFDGLPLVMERQRLERAVVWIPRREIVL